MQRHHLPQTSPTPALLAPIAQGHRTTDQRLHPCAGLGEIAPADPGKAEFQVSVEIVRVGFQRHLEVTNRLREITAHQRQTGHMARRFSFPAPLGKHELLRREPQPAAGLQLLLKRRFGQQGVAAREGRQSGFECRPLLGLRFCRAVQEPFQCLILSVSARKPDPLRTADLAQTLVGAAHQGQPVLQLRIDRQSCSAGNRVDQATGVVIPAGFAEGQDIPITEQRLQTRGQLIRRNLRQLGVLDEQGDQGELLAITAGEGGFQLMAHHVVGILEARQVGAISPAASDHSYTGAAGGQGLVDLPAPSACTDHGHIAENPLPAKPDPQPIPYPTAGSAGIITAVADENTVAVVLRGNGQRGRQWKGTQG